jgi:hypothetical protein
MAGMRRTLIVTMAVCTAATIGLAGAATALAAPTTAAPTTAAPTTAPAAGAPGPRSIPDRVMLQPEDLGGAVPGPVETGLAWPLLPRPCADAPLPRPLVSRAEATQLDDRYRVYENVARYPGNGARRYLDGLKAHLDQCGVGGGANGFDPVAEDHLGPDTVLFIGNYDQGDRYVGYVAAAVGRYVVVVMMSDAYLGTADLTRLNGLASAAMSRAAA